MKAYAAAQLNTSLLVPQLDYDAELALTDITPEFFTWLTRCAPFGIDNPEPTFLTRNVTLAAPVRLIQERHICLKLAQAFPEQPNQGRQPASPAISALGWSRGPTDWSAACAALSLTQGSAVDVLYRIRSNTGPYASPNFGGLELELRALRRAAVADAPADAL
jgi:single-stranded-DNA-specific exonuclease